MSTFLGWAFSYKWHRSLLAMGELGKFLTILLFTAYPPLWPRSLSSFTGFGDITCLFHFFLPPENLILTRHPTIPSLFSFLRDTHDSFLDYLLGCLRPSQHFQTFPQRTLFLGMDDPFVTQVWVLFLLPFLSPFFDFIHLLGLYSPS